MVAAVVAVGEVGKQKTHSSTATSAGNEWERFSLEPAASFRRLLLDRIQVPEAESMEE